MTSLIMPAWLPSCCYGVKVVNIAPGNASQDLLDRHASYLLFDARSGVPLAQMDGDEITARRTAASALADRWRNQGLQARACANLEAACGEADIVNCAFPATEPMVRGAGRRRAGTWTSSAASRP